jgi:outer membrane cobalamin receptor
VIRTSRLFVCLLLVFILSISPAAADPGDQLTGRVVDPDGRAVAGAHVLLVADGQALRSAVTNSRGEFDVDAPDSGPFDVRVSISGFRGELRRVDPAGTHDLGEIRLTLSAMSESVVVSAAQVEVPLSQVTSTVTVITGTELEARQIHSVADALRMVPGITVAATGGLGAVTGVFPRGGESNFTLVFVDDVPVTAFGGEFDFAHLSAANVERIEIVRGPQSALYGSNAIGAVIRVITRRGGAPAVSGLVEAGGYGSDRITGATSGSAGRFEWGASADHLTSDGYNDHRTAAGLTVQNDDYSRTAGAVSAGWREGGLNVRAQVQHATDEGGTPGPFGTNPVGAYTEIDTVARGENAQTLASVAATVPLGARVRSFFQTGYHRLESDFASAFGPSESSSRRWSGRAQIDFPAFSAVDVSAGVELQREQAGSTFVTNEFFEPTAVKRTIAGYFAEARWSAASRLFVTAGLRVEDIHRDAFALLPADDMVSVNPKAGVAWIVNPGERSVTKLRASAGTGIRPPGAFDIAFTDNPSLKPERSRSAEAGIEQTFAGGLVAAEAVGFWNEYDDLIVAVGSFRESSRYMTDNISNARAAGLELGLSSSHRLVARTPILLRGRVGYTFLDSEILAVDRDRQAPPPFAVGDPLLRRPRHQVSIDASATAGPLSLFLTGGARSRVLDVEPSLGTFGGLHYASGFNVWNVGGAWRLRGIGEVYARVENLFDELYEEALGFPALGRRATIGLRVVAGR